MLRICVVTDAPERFSDLTEALAAESDCEFDWSASVIEALSLAERCLPALMIIDESVEGRPALEVARQVIQKNAMINLVVVSRMEPEAFHEAAEGLGIAACLPPEPDPERPQILLRTLDLLVDGLNPH
jgi:DNA-binding NarL/FixJ family response regulator